MEGQLNLFDKFIETECDISKEDVKERKEELKYEVKCYKTELKSVENKTVENLFSGFDSIKVITFSYDLKFINSIMKNFKYGEIILGADFMVEKDGKLNNFLAEVLANTYEAGLYMTKYEKLVKMIRDGSLLLRSPKAIMDHRKIYLLKADDGRTRVIKGSANLTGAAWNGDHMEFYEYDDTLFCYEKYLEDFENTWNNSEDIPFSVVSSKKAGDKIEGNAILKSVKEKGKAIILKEPETTPEYDVEITKYVLDHKTIREEYKELLGGTNIKSKNGVCEIKPKTIEKMVNNKLKIDQKTKVTIHKIEEQYPSLTFNYDTKEAFLNGEKRDLNPSKEAVKKDIDELLAIFNNFNEFVDENKQLKHTHFKLLNVLFAAPHIAKLRCAAALQGIGTTSLPLFLLETSGRANCGKTFTTKVALKMMTGKELTPENKEDCSKDNLRNVQVGVKGTPFFIDELDNAFLARIKDLIKNPEKCEERLLEEQPLLVFASNDVIEPDETLRKRMVFLKFDGALPSTIDQNSYKSRGNKIIERIGTAFYEEYTKRMLEEMSRLLDYMIYKKSEIKDTWYPDIMRISSKIILSILKDYGYKIPSYMRELTWNGDYFGANYIAKDAIKEIKKEYNLNKEAFIVKKEFVQIVFSSDKESIKKLESWKNTLPSEMMASLNKNRDSATLTIKREELENKGLKFENPNLIKKLISSHQPKKQKNR